MPKSENILRIPFFILAAVAIALLVTGFEYVGFMLALAAVIPLVFWIDWRTRNAVYQCGKCGHEFHPTASMEFSWLWAGKTKLFLCPRCCTHVWCRRL